MTDNKEIYCKLCEYKTTKTSDWMKPYKFTKTST